MQWLKDYLITGHKFSFHQAQSISRAYKLKFDTRQCGPFAIELSEYRALIAWTAFKFNSRFQRSDSVTLAVLRKFCEFP